MGLTDTFFNGQVLAEAWPLLLDGLLVTVPLYVRSNFLPTLQPAWLDVLSAPWGADGPVLRDDARRFEKGESSLALLLGLGVAVKATLALGLPAIQGRIAELASSLRAQLAQVRGVQVLDLGSVRSGIVSFNVTGHDAGRPPAAGGARHQRRRQCPRLHAAGHGGPWPGERGARFARLRQHRRGADAAGAGGERTGFALNRVRSACRCRARAPIRVDATASRRLHGPRSANLSVHAGSALCDDCMSESGQTTRPAWPILGF